MNNKNKDLDIYLMGIGGTGMGAMAGLLLRQGHRVRGSDSAVYSPMREKLSEWGITYKTPYDALNLSPRPDLVIVGNVIRRDNPEAQLMRDQDLAYESFPSALRHLFLKNATSLVACGTHGKTTCSALLAHTLSHAGHDPGFLIGGIPLNFGESFRASSLMTYPFVTEGDEYDTAYFDKRPKFMHYQPNFLLLTSLEFDHGDIYRDLDAVIEAFGCLLKEREASDVVVVNNEEPNIKKALERAKSQASVVSYGKNGDYQALEISFSSQGIAAAIYFKGELLGPINIPLFGEHNLMNALGCYALLHRYGLSHERIGLGFASFKGVKRRLEQRNAGPGPITVDDFAHHPSAVRETIKAAKQKYPGQKIWAIFEPRSATSCAKGFESAYIEAFLNADKVLIAPLGRTLAFDQRLDTLAIAHELLDRGVDAKAHESYESLDLALKEALRPDVLLFMSNGDFQGHLGRFLSPQVHAF